MLVLTRKPNEVILIPELGIKITLCALSRTRASIGVDAPEGVKIVRQEIYKEKKDANTTH